MTILTADNGVAMVVMDRKDCIEETNSLLAQPAYRTINRDPINKLKAKLTTILRRIKREAPLQSFLDSLKSIKLTPPQTFSV